MRKFATGATIYAAAKWAKSQKCKRLIVAIPVGPKHTLEKLKEVADVVLCLHAPESFEAVGQFYRDFRQITDGEVMNIMRKYGYKIYYCQNAMAQ